MTVASALWVLAFTVAGCSHATGPAASGSAPTLGTEAPASDGPVVILPDQHVQVVRPRFPLGAGDALGEAAFAPDANALDVATTRDPSE
jgi:hypothetical protein